MTAPIIADMVRAPLYTALCDGLRWWLAFDGPRSQIIANRPHLGLTVDDIRSIALNYNFVRNLSAKTEEVQAVADEINRFAGKTWDSLDARAAEVEKSIRRIRKTGGRSLNLVSGTTKLSWFIASENWTPFDRLAAKAVRANRIDTIQRMRQFYEKLDAMDFIEKARVIDSHMSRAKLGNLSGCRILDKLLMISGEDDWRRSTQSMAEGFLRSLPEGLLADFNAVAIAILNDPRCHFDLGEIR